MAGETAEEQAAADAERRRTAAESNQRQNNSRLSRMEEIARQQDGRRASELSDVEGEQASGRFQGGEFDESPEARERAAQEEDDRAQAALDAEQENARRLQEEGGDEGGAERESRRAASTEDDDSEGESKVIDGIRRYRTIVAGQERWYSLRELRENASMAANAKETLQRAEEALQRSAAAALAQSEEPDEDRPDKETLANLIRAANMGDEEAIEKLASVYATRPKGPDLTDVDRRVSQQIATQRAIEEGRRAQQDILSDPVLSEVFEKRLRDLAQNRPTLKIIDAHKQVGESIRKDFAAMFKAGPESKDSRKRQIVTPPSSAGRRPSSEESDDREESVASQIDAMAKARGQDRAYRQRR